MTSLHADYDSIHNDLIINVCNFVDSIELIMYTFIQIYTSATNIRNRQLFVMML